MADRLLTDSPLRVSPEFVGARLASPARRFTAFGIDAALLLIPTIAASLLFATGSLYVRDRAGLAAIRTLVRARAKTDAEMRTTLAALLPTLIRIDAPGLPREVESLVEAGKATDAADLLKDYNFTFQLKPSDEGPAEKPPPQTVLVPIAHLIPGLARGGALFLIPALYFTAFTRGRRGATVGKRLMGIRVVRLDGHALSWWESFERFGGYLHIPASLFVGLIDLWHDPNRRMSHDRSAHTAVLRAR